MQETRDELERTLLGWMMAESESVLAADGLTADLFSDEFNRLAAGVILDRIAAGEVVSPLTVADACGMRANGDAKGYLLECFRLAVLCVCPREYVRSLGKERQRLRLLRLCADVTAKAEDGANPPDQICGFLLDGLEKVMRESSGVRIRSSRQVTEAVLEGLKEIAPCYSTGIVRLDQAMDGGLYAGKSYGIAARKKVGKTIIASTISCNLDLAGIPHLFVCGEMSDEEVHQRTLARLAQVYPSTFRNREQATPHRLKLIADGSLRLTGAAKFLNAPGLTFEQLKRAVSIALSRHGIKGFILDYWQLVGGKEKSASTAEHLDEVAQWIADFGRKHRIWTLVMAQINQEGNTRGGEGMRLAFDQVYHMQPCGNDLHSPMRWLELIDTRYTAWQSVGDKDYSALRINEFGPYFEEKEA